MYTIKQASLRSEVGVPLLRAWERRYHVVEPMRTPSGYRLYDDESIARLRAMRLLIEEGWSAHQAAERVRGADVTELAGLAGIAARPVTIGAEAPGVAGGEASRLAADLVQAAIAMQGNAMEEALDAAFAYGRFEAVAEQILLPALTGIGEAWARGELDVSGEHAASAAVQRRLSIAFEAAGRTAAGPAILVGMPEGSRHELAALAFATAARRSGMNVTYLGPDVPAASWVAAVERTGAAAVVVGAVMARDRRSAAATFAELRRLYPEVVRAIGGRHAASVRGEGHTRLPDGLGAAVAALQAALRPSPPPG